MPLTQTSLPDFDQPRLTLARVGSGLLATVMLWDFRYRSRNGLSRLTPHQLRDIGLDPMSAAAEASKPFWRD